jgi:valyl-tRNA synthetase
MRVTPAHDTVSLSIAKDHGLPLDVESFDASGNFSAHAGLFAGKPVDQFLLNITQNLSDIGNLIDKHPIKIKVPFSRITNEKLFSRTHKGRFLQIPEEIMTRFSEDENTRMCFGEDFDGISSIFPVSTPSALGYRLPIWTKPDDSVIIVDESSIVDAYIKNKASKKFILLSLFIFHAIQEGNLNARFGSEDAIACFFSAGFTKDQTLLTSWMELYKTRYPQYNKEYSAIQSILSRLNEDASDEKALSLLITHLENSFALTVDTH